MKNIFNRKSVFVKSLSVWSAFAVIITTSAPAFSAGTAVLGGSADLQNLTRATMDKNDTNAAVFSSDAASAVLDWNRFNIGSGQSMSFNGAGTTFFNLVDGAAGRSQIDGIINGSGNVWVINPAGIAFGASSSVNVGGLFAAAAGNLENAAALRDGTATMPSFSSFEGSVDASKGTFTASQVALMGKTVSAEGDFSNVGNLTISATGGAMDVDEVQGGKVSVNIRDFTADGSEVTLGDLHIDGDLTVKATGSIMAGAKAAETPANKPMLLMAEKKGPVIQAGDIDIEGADLEIEGKLQSTAGHVDVLAYGSLDVNAEVNAADYASLQALGDIDVNADVIAGGGDATIYSYNGSVTVEAGKTVSALGNVDITAGMGDGVNGDVTIDGNVESSFGNVMLYSGYGDQSTGDVTINGNVTAEYGGIDAYAGFGYALGTSGKLTVNGNLTGYSSVSLKTGNGDIIVGENSVVSATGFGGEVNVSSVADAGYGLMTGEGHTGNVEINGTLKADEAYGQVNVVAGQEAGATGSVTLNGKITSDYYSQLATTKGEVVVNNELTSLGNVMIDTGDGNITIAKDATVESKGGSQGMAWDAEYGMESSPSVVMLGAMDAAGTGNIKIDGTVRASDQNGQIVVKTGYDGNTAEYTGGKGDVEVNGSISAEKYIGLTTLEGDVRMGGEKINIAENMGITTMSSESTVSLNAENGASIKGDIVAAGDVAVNAGFDSLVIDSSIVANGDVTLETVNGDIVIENDAYVGSVGKDATVTLKSSTGGMMFDENYDIVYSDGDIIVRGGVAAEGENGTVNLYAANGFFSTGNVRVDGAISADEVSVVAGLTCPYNEILGQIYPQDTYGAGSVTINGIVLADSRVTIGTAASNVKINDGAIVKTTGENAALDVFSAFRAGQSGGVAINGTVVAENNGNIEITSAMGQGSEGSTTIGERGSVFADGSLTFFSGFDSTIYDNPDYVELFGLSGYGGLIGLSGKIGANNGISINSVNGVVSLSGSEIDAGTGDLNVNGGLEGVSLSGAVKAGNATFKSDTYSDYGFVGDVLVNDWRGSGVFAASGRDVSVAGNQGVELGDVKSTGDIRVYMNSGNITIDDNAHVVSSGTGSKVRIATGIDGEGAGDVTVKGTVSGGSLVQFSVAGNMVVEGMGKVTANESESQVLVTAKKNNDVGGDVLINGVVESGTKLDLEADGNVTIAKDAVLTVAEEGGRITLWSANSAGMDGDIVVDGKLSAARNNSQINMLTGFEGDSVGNVTIGKDAEIKSTSKTSIWTGFGQNSSGSIKIEGNISAGDAAAIYTGTGEIAVETGAKVDANNIYMATAASRGEGGSISIKGSLIGAQKSIVEADNGKVDVGNGGSVKALDESGVVYITAKGMGGDVNVNGEVTASGRSGQVVLKSADNPNGNGDVYVGQSGKVSAGAYTQIITGSDATSKGNIAINGQVSAGVEADIATHSGGISIGGAVSGGTGVKVITGINGGAAGNISFGAKGTVSGGSFVDLVAARGNITQSGASVSVSRDGYATPASLSASASAKEVNIRANGNVGNGTYDYFVVNGKPYGIISGNASIAAGGGASFQGGSRPTHTPSFNQTAVSLLNSVSSSGEITTSANVSSILAESIDWGGADDNSSIVADGNLSVYTAGALNPYGLLVAGRDLTVSAASFGDMSYLRAGGKLTINNVGHPSHPQIAYFESVNGVEPNINNLPNDMVIFIDGRLAGGNLNILNKFGANEAFMVETPELKSTQGIFGNPPFLHSDLDVANPMAVSAVDYLIQEVPRLTLSSDFPAEVDQNVEAVGLSQKDVYWFGQKESDEKKASDEAAEKTAETDKGSEKPSDKTVALVR